jgi:predicted nucleic acid-binding Zn ribbon protein
MMRRDGNRAGGPQAIGRIVSRLLARTGYDNEQGSEALAAAWRAAVPAHLADHSRPGRVRRGVLEVSVSHAAVAQEFGFHKRDVLARLTQALPGTAITDIRCRLTHSGS